MNKYLLYGLTYLGISSCVATGYVVVTPEKVITTEASNQITSNSSQDTFVETKGTRFVSKLIEKGCIGLNANVDIKDDTELYQIYFEGALDYQSLDNFLVDGKLNFSFKGFSMAADIAYLDSILYFATPFMNAKLNVNTFSDGLFAMLEKMEIMIPDFSFSLEGFNEQELLNKITNLNFIAENGFQRGDFALNDDIVISFYTDDNMNLEKVTSSFSYQDITITLKADINSTYLNSFKFTNPESVDKTYIDVESLYPLANNLYQLVNKKQFNVDIKAAIKKNKMDYSELSCRAVFDIDTHNIYGDFAYAKENKDYHFMTSYYDQQLYFDLNGICQGKLHQQDVLSIYDIVKQYIDDDTFQAFNASLSSALNNTIYGDIKKGDYHRLETFIHNISLVDNNLEISFDGTYVGLNSNNVTISLDAHQQNIVAITIANVVYGDYELSLNLLFNDYSGLPVINQSSFDDYSPLLTIYDELLLLTKKQKAAFELSTNIIDNGKSYTVDGIVQFALANDYQSTNQAYVSLSINDNYSLHTLVMEMNDDDLYFVYNDKLKGQIKVATVKEIFAIITDLINDDDPLLSDLLSKIPSSIEMGVLGDILNDDYSSLSFDVVKNIAIKNEELHICVGQVLLDTTQDFNLSINYENDSLNQVTIKDFMYGDLNLDGTISLTTYDESLGVNKEDTYYDLNSLKTMLFVGINSMHQEYYHLLGNVDIKIMTFTLDSVPIEVKIHNKNGKVDAEIIFSSIPIIALLNTISTDYYDSTKQLKSSSSSNRQAHIYISDGFIYIHRQEEVKFKKSVISISSQVETFYQEIMMDSSQFFSNFGYYLFKFIFGFNDTMYNYISSSLNFLPVEEMKFDSLVNDYVYDDTKNEFYFDVNFEAITGDKSVDKATFALTHTDEDYRLDALSFDITIESILKLNGEMHIENYGESLSLEDLTNYISNYHGEINIEYCSHSKQ